MKKHTWALLVWLPLMTVATLLGWLVFGALPRMELTGDLIAWLLELPVITCYAIAAGGFTMLTMHWTGINIDNDRRAELFAMALEGNEHARNLLEQETRAWLGFLCAFAAFFFPHW